MIPAKHRNLVFLLLICNACPTWAAAAKGSSNTTQAALTKLSNEKKQMNADLTTARSKQSALQKQLRDVELRISKTSIELRRTRQQIQAMAERLTMLEQRVDTQDSALEQHKARIAEHLVRRYTLTKMQRVALVANADDSATVARQSHYLDTITHALTDQADILAQQTTALQQSRDDIQTQQRALEILRTEQSQQLAALQQDATEQQRITATLSALIDSKSAQLSTLNENENRLRAALKRITAAQHQKPTKTTSTPSATVGLQGKLELPVRGPILRPFGGNQGAASRSLQGMVIAATSGEEVHAVAEGRVVFAEWMRGYGLLVIVDHGKQLLSLYGQNESLLKSVGDRVAKGEAIANAGQSGGQDRPGVYFELRYRGQPVDPSLWWRQKG